MYADQNSVDSVDFKYMSLSANCTGHRNWIQRSVLCGHVCMFAGVCGLLYLYASLASSKQCVLVRSTWMTTILSVSVDGASGTSVGVGPISKNFRFRGCCDYWSSYSTEKYDQIAIGDPKFCKMALRCISMLASYLHHADVHAEHPATSCVIT